MPIDFVLPGHHYLGPGNAIQAGTPVDSDDLIAKLHDIKYSQALTDADIKQADVEAIKAFFQDFKSTGNWHSLLGASGLEIMHLLESVFGVIYPHFKRMTLGSAAGSGSGTQKRKRLGLSKTGAQKKRKSANSTNRDMFETSDDEGMETMGNTQAANIDNIMDEIDSGLQRSERSAASGSTSESGSGAMSLTSSLGGPQLMRSSFPRKGSTTYKRSRLMSTWGNACKGFAFGSKEKKNLSHLMMTGLHCFPVEIVPTYLRRSEYDNLPPGSFVKEVRVKVKPKGVRCSFDTRTTLSGSANNSQIVFGQSAVGLNHKLVIRNRRISRNATNKMVLEQTYEIKDVDLAKAWPVRLYGPAQNKGNVDDDAFNTSIPCSLGAIRSIPFHMGLMINSCSEYNKYSHATGGWPELDKYVTTYNFMDHVDLPCINYSYRPKLGIIKGKHCGPLIDPVDGTTRTEVSFYTGNSYVTSSTININMDDCTITHNKDPVELKNFTSAYCQLIEKGTNYTNFNNSSRAYSQPSVHFGINAVQSNTPNDTSPEFVNACAIWQIDTEIDIGINTEYVYPYDSNAGNMEQVWGHAITPHVQLTSETLNGFLCTKYQHDK